MSRRDQALGRLADLISGRPKTCLAVSVLAVAAAAPVAINVRSALQPRGFDVAGSGSVRARRLVEERAGVDPANSVLVLFRSPSSLASPPARRSVRAIEAKLRADPAVVAVLDAQTTGNPAMISRDRRETYLIAQLRPLDDKGAEAAGERLLAAFADDPRVTLGGNPVANREISVTIERDLRRAELLSVPLIVVLSFFIFRGFVASLLAPLAGLITVLASFFVVRLLAGLTDVSIYALNLVTGL